MVKQFQYQQNCMSNCIRLCQLPSLEVVVPGEGKREKGLKPMAKQYTESVKYLNVITAS